MRKLLFLFLTAGLVLSCQNSKNYTISGSVADEAYEGTNVYVQEMTNDAYYLCPCLNIKKRLK